ncbi:sugar phosphate isomerase/epimerase [Streptomyces sp. SB3404]|uniref:Sugar phosphate isomerase/epimerase n=2 Tax=Streptomyces boncukensis TaxID=2711219 RepID=A0A6G4WZ01_9ACTN|nr:sugar phosphate isomerase/epimerase [Streptomyces boncukensis]
MSLLNQQNPFFAHPHLAGSVWPDPVRDTFEDRVAAVAAVGSPGMGMGAYELEEVLKTRSLDSLLGVAAEHGVHIGEIELLLGWHADGEEGEQARRTEEQLFSWAEAFGAERVKTSAVFFPPAGLPPMDLLVERFAALCDRAAERGLAMELEPFAVFPAFHYGVAADVVAAADRPNGGLLIDAWHLFRDPNGPGALERVEGRHITGVELCDGAADPVGGDLQKDCVDSRMLPGEGDFDLVWMMRTLEAKGVDVPLSTEVLSAQLRELTPKEVATRTTAAVRKLLSAAAPA